MEPPVTGVRLVLSNFADPARAGETGRWYDEYAHRLADAGALLHARRFENVRASGSTEDAQFLALYDLVTSDPAEAWPKTEASASYPNDMFGDPVAQLVVPLFRSSYALVAEQGGPFTVATPRGALVVLLSDGGDDTVRSASARDAIAAGLVRSAARFRLVEGSPTPPAWLELYNTVDSEPAQLLARLTAHRPAEVLDRGTGVFTPIAPEEPR